MTKIESSCLLLTLPCTTNKFFACTFFSPIISYFVFLCHKQVICIGQSKFEFFKNYIGILFASSWDYLWCQDLLFIFSKILTKRVTNKNSWEARRENKPEILSAWKAWVKFFNTSNFPIISQVTQIVQSTSHPSCPMSKFPKL